MSFTYDPSTDAGKVRLLATDTDSANPVFSDAEISGFLAIAGDNTKLAAAYALDTIAASQALILKKVKTLDLQTDGPAVAAALRSQAKALREADASDGVFDVAEQVHDVFGYRERIGKQIQRGAL